jgi:hypothetical protein
MNLLIPLCILFAIPSLAQNVNQYPVKPKGVYSQINMVNDQKMISQLTDGTHNRQAMNSVIQHAGQYSPPVLYVLSDVLFKLNRKDEAAYWFYIAQLRARYDINRCADKTATAARYNEMYGPQINKYTMQGNLDKLTQLINKVVAYVATNNESYDQRWINLEGMGAMQSSLDGKQPNALSMPQSQWASIKAKTIADYQSGFKEALAGLRKNQ